MAGDRFLDKLDHPSRPVRPEISDRVLELWREYQTELAKHDVTDHAMQLELDVWQAMRLAPGADTLPEETIQQAGIRQSSATTSDPVGGSQRASTAAEAPPQVSGHPRRLPAVSASRFVDTAWTRIFGRAGKW